MRHLRLLLVCFVGMRVPVVSSWFTAVTAASYYQSEQTYDSNNNIEEQDGRTSSVSVCNHTDDTAGNLDGIADSTCLQGQWLGN